MIVEGQRSKLAKLWESWLGQVPSYLSWISFFAAIFSFTEYVFRHSQVKVLWRLSEVLDFFNVMHGPSIFIGVLLLIFAGAAYRRKRAVVWLICLTQAILLAADVASLVYLEDFFTASDLRYAAGNTIVSVLILALALASKRAFPAKINRTAALWGSLALAAGQVIVIAVGLLLVNVFPGRLFEERQRIGWVLTTVYGYNIFLDDSRLPRGGYVWIAWLLSALSLLALALAAKIFLGSQNLPLRSRQDDLKLHQLLVSYPHDSLDYFASGTERRVVFSSDGKAAVAYAVLGDIALAGGNPVGDPESWDNAIAAWLKSIRSAGLVPGVVSCAEDGAKAYKKQGFKARALGDEAIVMIEEFDLDSPAAGSLAAAKRRVRRAGVEISCRRLSDIDGQERIEIAAALEALREGAERGYSMSLDRILSPIDSQQVVVCARGSSGELQAILTFVPWGAKGLSLNLMRRSRSSVNGVIEAMVLALIDYGREHRVAMISLNFAMLRQIFVQGRAVDATLGQRLLYRLMLLASSVWQLDSLRESNARYFPQWRTRYLAYDGSRQLTPTLVAAAALEGFLPVGFLRAKAAPEWLLDPAHAVEIEQIYLSGKRHPRDIIDSLADRQSARQRKACSLEASGMDLYPPGDSTVNYVPLAAVNADAVGGIVRLRARIGACRRHGKLCFIDLYEGSSSIQLLLGADISESYHLTKFLSNADVVDISGEVGYSDTGELTVFVKTWQVVAKAMQNVSSPAETIKRGCELTSRTAQFIATPRSLELLRYRSYACRAMRNVLEGKGYLEVETPILHPVKGGANARPFTTYCNAYKAPAVLRIAPELYLKRLIVGGMTAVFEMGRSFRNEGVDATHNPEFTSLEAYRVGCDYNDMRILTEQLIREAARSIHGTSVLWVPRASLERLSASKLSFVPEVELLPAPRYEAVDRISAATSWQAYCDAFWLSPVSLVEIDLSQPWPVVAVLDAISAVVGIEITTNTSLEDLLAIASRHGLAYQSKEATWAKMVEELYEELVEPRTTYPTFYVDFPAETSPLARPHRENPVLAERWDLVAFGMELATAYTELADPREQRQRFIEQSLALAAGDSEAMSLDQDFLDALDLGMPPTGGLGMGIDRVIMLVCGIDIKQAVSFPFTKPRDNQQK